MAQETTDDPKKRLPVKKIDFTKPFYITVRQSTTRNIFELFQGKNACELALASADKQAVSGKETVAVLGPQQAVSGAPEPVIAKRVALDWNKTDEPDAAPH